MRLILDGYHEVSLCGNLEEREKSPIAGVGMRPTFERISSGDGGRVAVRELEYFQS